MNAYEVLGLAPGASKAQAKLAYRKLANLYHPDRNPAPEASDKFKLVKEAYEFITKGTSSTKAFVKKTKSKAPKPAPEPKPDNPDATVWATGYGAKSVAYSQVLLTFGEAFTGTRVKIKNTPFVVHTPPGVQHGFKERRLCENPHGGPPSYFDLEYFLYDPLGFYKLQEISGQIRFCCHLEMTAGQLISGFEHSFKSVNPNAGQITIVIPSNFNHHVVIPRAGMRLGASGHQSDLYVIPVVKMIPIEKEIYPVLKALDQKVKEAIKTYKYFQ